MTRDEIKQTIDGFLSLIENGCGSTENNEATLKLFLDKLAMAQHFAAYKFDENEYPDAPAKANSELRKLVTVRFPNYGYYNLAEDVSQKVGETGLMVGDAIDDIAGIAGDLIETKWRWEKNSIEDGLWYFRDAFETHWARHLRDLQIYLLNLDRGT
jgi:hypothetical protein